MNNYKRFLVIIVLATVMVSSFPVSVWAEDDVKPPAVTQSVDGCPNCHQPDPTPTPKPSE